MIDEAALNAALSLFPADRELLALKWDLLIRRNDLDGDGIPERVLLAGEQLSVVNGRDGTIYLTYSFTPRPGKEYGKFGVLGDGGDRFFLVDLSPGASVLWHFDGRQLVQVREGISFASFSQDRQMLSRYPDGANGYYKRRTWQDGKLVDLGRVMPGNTKSQDLVDLAIAVHTLQPWAFATDKLYMLTVELAREKVHHGLLLPTGGGTYRLELWVDGQVAKVALATIDKEWRISNLDWK